MAIELSDELIELERAAWAEQQENRLTVETAARVQRSFYRVRSEGSFSPGCNFPDATHSRIVRYTRAGFGPIPLARLPDVIIPLAPA
ncbi:hypothetical protein [Streptomyces sp. LN500]|uniref:hypothetical protein n=1 Tax=unclassified Streptomyces TaxID=2593676 RepID=UPI0037133645